MNPPNLLLQLCLMLMLKGSRVCKTQGRSYPPQMEYCVRVYEFLKSWNSNCRCKPALQLQAQAASLDTQGLGRRTKCPIKGDPPLMPNANCLSPNNHHTKAFPKWPKLFGINKPFLLAGAASTSLCRKIIKNLHFKLKYKSKHYE